MNLHWIDWTICLFVLSCIIAITFCVSRYNRSVGDFLAAGRLGRRYLMCVAGGFGGAISLIGTWEMMYLNGLPVQWWSMMTMPLGLFIALTGFVTYRFRETRALTLAQFFEMRYSTRFRFFSGALCWLSGALNYGIFPHITTKFIITFFGFPERFQLAGLSIPTFPVIMFIYLSIAVFIACRGGQIGIMLTDFFQGILLLFVFLIIMFFFLHKFQWADIVAGLKMAPEGKSLIYPLKTSDATDFNIWYFLIGIMGTIYTVKAWQGHSGYNASAKTPHEAVMSGVIGTWRTLVSQLCMILLPICAYAVMHLPKFASLAGGIQSDLDQIADATARTQMIVPVFMSHTLPIGLTGLFAVVIMACAISCDDTYLHAWGTIFIQDVIMPLRKKPFAKENHLKVLRYGIIGVAVFAYLFSLVFSLKDSIYMYFAITGAIYMGGAGSVIIGGLYWKRGTTIAAWASLITGTVFGLGGILIQQIWKPWLAPLLVETFPNWSYIAAHTEKFPLNGQYVYFITMLSSILVYVLVSLLGPRKVFNLDKLLHRGEFADEMSAAALKKQKFSLAALIGINSNFTLFDRIVAWASTCWSMGWWLIFLIFTTLGLCTTWITDSIWETVWWWKLVPFTLVLGTGCTFWIAIGGLRDAYYLIRDLAHHKGDDSDNGFVEKEK